MQHDGPECTPTYLLFTANLDGAKSSSTRLRQHLMLTPFLSVSVYSVVSLSFPVTKKTGSARSANMGRFWTFLTHAHTLSGPVVMLLYPLYATVIAIESSSRDDDEQWLAYWILYSFLTLTEMLLQSILEWIPIWYSLKLLAVAWLVLPQFKGAAFIYERFVREHARRFIGEKDHPHPHHKSTGGGGAAGAGTSGGGGGRGKSKFVHFISPNKEEHKVY
ncbi:hypothetical protein OIU78_030114 [Salix suchowensis]|nr:hypothetical protein OIU78_030114 [Salix suchowensis]